MTTEKAVYQAFYTKSDPIVNYMTNLLSLEDGLSILEPCAGDGVFVDALLEGNKNLQLELYELDLSAVSILTRKYKNLPNISITHGDFLTSSDLERRAKSEELFDRAIGNPPYGGWQDFDKRKRLKKLYPGLYVKETYALFIVQSIRLLREGGVLVFIIPDTFLNLHMHAALRRFLFTNTKVLEIALFPSAFFPGVNFGYSNLSIIAVQKTESEKECLDHELKVINGFKKVTELGAPTPNTEVYKAKQKDILGNADHALYVSKDPKIGQLLNNHPTTIGDIADCVTGFYSGDDKTHLRVSSKEVRNSARYQLVSPNDIARNWWELENNLEGIDDKECFIPIVKGGGIRYFKPDLWFMDWSKEAVSLYKSNKKARFQNAKYYFKRGIAVPMVSSTQISGSIMEQRLFDQSIVGIFPEDPELLYYLLAFFNSPTCNTLIRTINPTTNNSANYIKKIPFIKPPKTMLADIEHEVKRIIGQLKRGEEVDGTSERSVQDFIKSLYGF